MTISSDNYWAECQAESERYWQKIQEEIKEKELLEEIHSLKNRIKNLEEIVNQMRKKSNEEKV
jgi:ppGpp synthetase/RelA/SpoT-type nucleotidyltranferase